jgi:elongation factor P
MQLNITELKKGTLLQLGGIPYKVLEYNQKVMGRGGSIVNVRIRSLIDGKVLDKTFKGNEQLEGADVTIRNVQYLYNDGAYFHFMDEDSFDQFDIATDIIGDQAGYLKEGDKVQAQMFNSIVINVELPKNVPLKVVYSEHAVKGDTTSNVLKNAELETGISVKVPLFIKTGDTIRIDTRTGTYLDRVKT